MEQSDTSNKG